MAAARVCRVCRAILTENDAVRSPGLCPYCGAETDFDRKPRDNYAPPRTDAEVEEVEARTGVPVSVGGKLNFALRLFLENFFLISGLVLTVWIPFHLLLNYLIFHTPDLDERRLALLSHLGMLIETVFGPISMGGILFALSERMDGRCVTYRQSLRVGLYHWGRLFSARFFANLWIFLGILAFIVPGIILSIRFILLESVVLVEDMGPKESRGRSSELVENNALGICLGYLLLLLMIIGLEAVLGTLIESEPSLKSMWVAAGADCVVSVLSNLITCFLFVYFWEGHVLRPADPARDYAGHPFAGWGDRF